ncbi:MAG: NAD(P)-dependent malic enzyme [Candidatus Saccharimonadales bacterium]
MDYAKEALNVYKQKSGVLSVKFNATLKTKQDLSTYYTPGVGAVSSYLYDHPEKLKDYTWVKNSLAVISDGSAVLGLGDIGPKAALPVMTGKSLLFKSFANIDAVPIVLDVHTIDEIVEAVAAIAPSFGAINLEDIKAPECFEIEARLVKQLSIPLMHDDQHGTAVVVLAGLINAMKVTGKNLSKTNIVIIGAGAAGVAVAKLIHDYAKPNIITVDSKGIVSPERKDLTKEKKYLATLNKGGKKVGSLQDALKGADIFIGVSRANLLTESDIKLMAKNPIIFAMANPIPEIMPDIAQKAGAAIVATGRSDFPNQINNVLAFPGIFRGALDHNVKRITEKHKVAAAEALASIVKNPTKDKIIPSPFDKNVVPTIAKVIS